MATTIRLELRPVAPPVFASLRPVRVKYHRRGLCHHNILIASVMDKKHNIQNTIGPEAPLNLKPRHSASIDPDVCSKNMTMHNEAKAAHGNPIVAGK